MKNKAIFLSVESAEYTSKKDGQRKVYRNGNFLVNGNFMQFMVSEKQFTDLSTVKVATAGELEIELKAFQGKPYVSFVAFTW